MNVACAILPTQTRSPHDCFHVVDDFTHDSLALVADTSISSVSVGRELDAIIARHGKPRMIVSDGGAELTSMAILRWSQAADIAWRYIAPSVAEAVRLRSDYA
jgi:hypothetical protein